MVSRYDFYEATMRRAGEDDQTLADRFVTIFRDLDSRIQLAEGQAAGAVAIEEYLRRYGAQLVDAAVSPIVSAIRAAADLGALLTTSSVTSVAVGLGPRTFVIAEADREIYAPSHMLAVVANDDPSCVMWGRRVTYNSATGELVMEVLAKAGTGTYSSWVISVGTSVRTAGEVGAAPNDGFAGVSVQALLDELMDAVDGDPDFVGTVSASITAAAAAARSEAVSDIRGGVAAELDTLAEVAVQLASRLMINASQALNHAQRKTGKVNLGVLGGSVLTKTSNYTLDEADNGAVILVNAAGGARTITLPDHSVLGPGYSVAIKKVDAGINAVTVAGASLDGGTSVVLTRTWQSVTLASEWGGWRVVSESGDQPALNRFASKTANYTVVLADNGTVMSVDASAAARTITLPAATAVPAGYVVAVKKVDASVNTVTVAATIDGATNLVLRLSQQTVMLISDGAAWYVTSEAGDQPPLSRFASKTANYTVILADNGATLAVDASGAARTITLPAATAVPIGFGLTVKKSDTSFNSVTVAGTIDAATNYVLRLPKQAVRIVSDGTAWSVVSESGTVYTTTFATGRVTRWADGRQVCTHIVTMDYTGAFSAADRLYYSWTLPAAFVSPGPEHASLALPMHQGAHFVGISGGNGGRSSVRAFGPDGSTGTTTVQYSIFFDAGAVSTTNGAIARSMMRAEGMWV